MEASLKEFLSRPENRPLVEAHQRKEARQALKFKEKAQALTFREKVLEASFEAQQNIAPFLDYPVLRKVIQTFTNDARGDFDIWATNQQALAMLQEAKRMLDSGSLTEEELEQNMLRQLQDDANPGAAEFQRASRHVIRLPTDQLVGALNEHLTERRSGNDHYKQCRFVKALKHYERALSIVELVQGMSQADQAEIDTNRQTVLLNMAAVHLALERHGQAVTLCSRVIEADPTSIKALLRRAKALASRHEYQAAQADLDEVRRLDPLQPGLHQQEQRLQQLISRSKASDHALIQQMLPA
ncbi:hypothetical protein WJX84_006359 [Apatococcus fuscideae]|uniref:Tetratricopeptide repeat protein n=1 Tax=Apatococcus fuscideae TaxID=2026836 RepID=A0AAW1RNP5_9CHLO